MFRTMARGGLLASVLLAVATTAQARSFDDVDIAFWLGAGPNEAVIVVDWKSQDPNELYAKAFGFRWSGDATGADVLNALSDYVPPRFLRVWEPGFENTAIRALGWDADESGDVTPDPNGPDWYEEGFGLGNPPGFWVHFASADGEDWGGADVDITKPLIPGHWEGWSWDAVPPPGDDPPGVPEPPNVPVVPEPATCLLVGLGLAALACRKRRGLL